MSADIAPGCAHIVPFTAFGIVGGITSAIRTLFSQLFFHLQMLPHASFATAERLI
jgi:hypothetical protein